MRPVLTATDSILQRINELQTVVASFIGAAPLDEGPSVRWMGFTFSFRSNCLTREGPRSPLREGGSGGSAVGSNKNLLQTPHSLCRMVACTLE